MPDLENPGRLGDFFRVHVVNLGTQYNSALLTLFSEKRNTNRSCFLLSRLTSPLTTRQHILSCPISGLNSEKLFKCCFAHTVDHW